MQFLQEIRSGWQSGLVYIALPLEVTLRSHQPHQGTTLFKEGKPRYGFGRMKPSDPKETTLQSGHGDNAYRLLTASGGHERCTIDAVN